MTDEERDVKTLLEWFEPDDLSGPVRGHKVWCDVVSRYERTGQLNIDCDCGFTEMSGVADRLTARLAAAEKDSERLDGYFEQADLLVAYDHPDGWAAYWEQPEGDYRRKGEHFDDLRAAIDAALANAAGEGEGGDLA